MGQRYHYYIVLLPGDVNKEEILDLLQEGMEKSGEYKHYQNPSRLENYVL